MAEINNPLRGIYIRGATMPETCKACPMRDPFRFCSITGSNVFYHNTDRAADCPIVETEEEPEIRLYDKEELYHGCTVQVLTNTVTGAVSVGWMKEEKTHD